ncbi:MAG TPA: Rrf2 family transcriptional regulator [Caldithrix abyssi]|uniref:Rrf2 family transcriptional regulator n=1 Tax=Caldithrix abyssi TaxID=187145 RepID=A0A7V1LNX9_CALAY|nr:Rrf2 family transcriptional regulator [Caldithrix abyssi]
MLRLSKKSEYAIIALVDLAGRQSEEPIPVKQMAESYKIPGELLGKIFQTLKRSGLVYSVQGTKGGYQLSRSPREITLSEIIESIEGPISLMSCFSELDCDCLQFSSCTIKSPLQFIQNEIKNYFQQITLDTLKDNLVKPLTQFSVS